MTHTPLSAWEADIPDRLRTHAGKSVLVVDDNDGNLAYMSALLAHHGLTRVYTLSDSRQVAAELVDKRPDLVILDLHMPFLDGFAILEQIQAFAGGRYLPVIVMTADTTPDARNRALELGAQDFLVKPVDAVEAALRIANLLQTVEIYGAARNQSLPSAGADDQAITERITSVLRGGSLEIAFQPVVELAGMESVGHEALSRFTNPDHGGPDAWFAAAARVGLGFDLERFAVEQALVYLHTVDPPAFLAVNMSPATLIRLSQTEVVPDSVLPRLVVELTEHELVEDYQAVESAFAPWRDKGARLAADDLGSGVANLRHLLRLRPEIIKLDISLVAGIDSNAEQRALVRGLISFANEVGSCVIAEGVEEPAELDVLRDLGAHWAQGYLLGRPGPLEVHRDAS